MLPLPRLPAVAALDSALFIGTNWTDLTDGGATTLHKHDHGGQDGLTDDDHTGYARLDGRAGSQILIGGTGVNDAMWVRGTSGNGTLTVEAIRLMVGNNGDTIGLSILNSGRVGLNWTPSANVALTIGGTVTSADNAFGMYLAPITLAPANGWNAYCQYFGGNVISVGAGVTCGIAIGGLVAAMTKSGAGTVTNSWGMYVDVSALATNNYGIYSGGKVGIATLVPTEMLHVTGNGLFTGSILSSGLVGIGYAAGSGGAQTQGTSKATTVTLNALCGTITTHNAQLNAATIVSFQVTNSTVAATDVIHVQHDSGGTLGAYTINASGPAAGHFHIDIRNNTAGNLSEALVIRFAVIKAVAS